ncbi:hypothetical protein CEXT_656611 [Caerostris extrusa]|uniref:Uncharacterized protein n=1 Tax=Caerostris extrusa TaxID=172846 RepID=A0AAV4X5F5_CAEEX|nr:hypothetical protein CEXT_656611 [Caerostris extrusa]
MPCPLQRRVIRLYEMFCETRGEWYDPFTLHFTTHNDYVNPVYWQSAETLQEFILKYPNNVLAQSIERLITQSIDQILRGEFPTCLRNKHSLLFTFLKTLNMYINPFHKSLLLTFHPKQLIRFIDY